MPVIINQIQMNGTNEPHKTQHHNSNTNNNTYQQYGSNNLLPKTQNTQPDSIEQILSSSIQRAKQKINMLQTRQKQQRPISRQKTSSRDGQSSNAIASAMRVLQVRVNELEKAAESHEREKGILLQQIDNLTSQKKMLLQNFEDANKKVTSLEQSIRNFKNQIKGLSHKLEDAGSEKNELDRKCKELEMNIRHLQNDKQKLNQSIAKVQQEQSKQHNQAYKLQKQQRNNQSEEKDKAQIDRQQRLSEKQRRLGLLEGSLRQRQARVQTEKGSLQQTKQQNQLLKKEIFALRNQLNGQRNKQNEATQNYELYLKQIGDMQREIQLLRQTTKNLQNQKGQPDGLQTLRDQVSSVQNKYEDLFRHYKRSEEKCKREQKELKSQTQRTRELEDLLSQIIQKIGKLPSSTKDLKYLSVRGSKMMQVQVEKMTTLKTPTKSRSNSINRSFSRSNSQRKTLQTSTYRKTQVMQQSIRSNQKRSGSKSKKRDSTSRSTKKQVGKKVIVSQGGWQSLERQIVELKKQYKKMVKELDACEMQVDGPPQEQARNRLNQLAFAIQERSERVTQMRQAGRIK